MTIYDEIKAERIRQDEKYGKDRNLTPQEWNRIIRDELTESEDGFLRGTEPPHDYRTEMIQLITLGVAAIESLDRQRK